MKVIVQVEPTGHVTDVAVRTVVGGGVPTVGGGYPGVAAKAGAPIKSTAPTTAAAPKAISLRMFPPSLADRIQRHSVPDTFQSY